MVYYYYYYYSLKRAALQGWKLAIYTLPVQRPQPRNTNPQKERKEWEHSRRQKGSEQLEPHHRIHMVGKIVPQRHENGNKNAAVLRVSAARMSMS